MKANLIRPQTSLMSVRASRGFVRGELLTTSGPKQIRVPPSNYDILDGMVRNDEVISTAFDTTVDVATRNGWDFTPKKDSNSKLVDKALKKFSDLRFSEILDNVLYSMLYYGDAFLELRRNNSTQINELHVLESTEMRIAYTENGEVTAYVQRPFNMQGLSDEQVKDKEHTLGVWFKPDEVIHFTIKKVGSSVYSQTPLEPVARLWANKMSAHAYLKEAYDNLPPEILVHLKGADKAQAEDFMQTLYRRKMTNGMIPVSYGGEESGMEVKEVQFKTGDAILKVLEYLREAVLMITRVPPVWVGMVNKEGSNRGNSEAQIFSFETRVRKIQQKIQDKINWDLMPKLNLSGVDYNFNPVTSKNESDVMKNAAVLKGMNVKPEAIVKYLKRNGVTDVMAKDFETPEDMMLGGGNQAARNITSPSRSASDKDMLDRQKDLNQFGTSDAGGAKTEEKDAKQR